MSILVIADHNNQTLNSATFKRCCCSSKIGGDITVLDLLVQALKRLLTLLLKLLV